MADLQSIQDAIEILVNNDRDTPDVEDDEWTIRLGLINLAIDNWSSEDTLWNELWTTYTHDGSVTNATTYDLTFTDFRFPGSQLRLVLNGQTTYVKLVPPGEAQNYVGQGRVAYITGSTSAGFVLNFNWTPAPTDGTYGASIIFDYYKVAAALENATDEPEMSDTSYITYWAAAQKSLLESQNNKYTVFSNMATQSIETMKLMNTIGPPNQPNVTDDIDALNGSILGE
jgi:hypothetical protein